MSLVLDVAGVRKRYRPLLGRSGTEALAGVDLQVEEGAAFGLIGPNGAGKTTFIKILLGVVRPDEGQVRVLGGSPEDPCVRARIGYLPERLHLPNAWRARDFLRSVARLKGQSQGPAALEALLARVGLHEVTGKRIGGFSKGMRQRLGLAAALLGAPDLLILDEPTDGVDPLGRVEVRHVLAEELQRGAALFLNSHLLSETERICTRVGILARGRLVREGPLALLTQTAPLYRVRFAAGLPARAIEELGFTPAGAAETFHLTAEDAAALNARLDQARAAGALLVELTRESKDLEDVYAEAVGRAA